MSKSKKKTFIAIFSVIILLGLVSGGIYLFYSFNRPMTFFNERNGMSLQAFFYDSNGNPITGFGQTIVDGTEGQFYMSMQIRTSNTGNVDLTAVDLVESHPDALTQALQGGGALVEDLFVGQSNVLQWDTKNICTTVGTDTVNCGASEKCVNIQGQGLRCLIDISNFIGEILFGATIQAQFDYLNGSGGFISTTVSLPINFEQDTTTFRTNAPIVSTSPISLDFSATGTQVATDRDSDGTLEAYTRESSVTVTYYPADFITYTPDNKIVARYSSNKIRISRMSNLDNNIQQTSMASDSYFLGGTIPTVSNAIEPYRFQNCGVVGQLCQERYSIVVAPPTQQCGNNVREGTELCDGTDLVGSTCQNINQGFDGGTLICGANCDAWDTSQCTAPGGAYMKFRTSSLTYASGTNAVAYSSACDGTNLNRYGYVSVSAPTSYSCQHATSGMISRTTQCGASPVMIMSSSVGGFGAGYSGTPSIWQGSDPAKICVCQNENDGSGYKFTYYSTGDADNGAVDNSATSVDSPREVAC